MFRRIFFTGLLAGVLCLGVARGQEANGDKPKQEFSLEYQQAYEKAIQLFNQNDFDGTLKQLDAADKVQPAAVATENLRGAVYVRLKKYEDAQKIFADLYQKDTQNMMALFNLAETYFLQKNYAEALKYFQSFAEKSKTQNSLGVYKVFLCNLQLGKETEAKKSLDDTQASVSDPLYYYLHAAYLFKQGKQDDARGYLASAFQIYSGQANAAFIDSLIELGYVSPDDIKASGGADAPVVQQENHVPAKQQPATAPAAPDISGLENLLPSLDGNKNK